MAAGTTKHAALNSSKRSTRHNQKGSNGKSWLHQTSERSQDSR